MRAFQMIPVVFVIGLSGCTSQGLYYTGQAWRRSLCNESIGDERARCESEASKTFSEYQKVLAVSAPETN